MNAFYHYRLSGLDYVYLVNGFTRHNTEYGPGISIEDVDSLHKKIAHHVVASLFRLRGQEVRFLRSMLDISQAVLAHILGTKRLTIVRWEAKPHTPIPGTADRALRLFFALKMEGNSAAAALVDFLTEIDEAKYSDALFEETPVWTFSERVESVFLIMRLLPRGGMGFYIPGRNAA